MAYEAVSPGRFFPIPRAGRTITDAFPQLNPASSEKFIPVLCFPQPGPTLIRRFLIIPEIDGQKKIMIAATMIGNAIGSWNRTIGLPRK